MKQKYKFARRIFQVAGIYGLVLLVPMYFLETKLGQDFPPAITHPEFFYGFIGVAITWQVVFLVLAKDPVQYRSFIIPAILEKLSYGFAVVILFAQGRIPLQALAGGLADFVFAAFFFYAYRITKS